MSEFDVTLCKFYDDEICYNEECVTKYCDGYECIFKEIYKLRKQKENLIKENEELKNKNNSIHSIADGLQQRNHNLTLENEELRKYIDKAGIAGIIKVLKCLDEIEGIINNFANEDIITLPDLSKEKNYKLIAEQYAEPIKQIQQKIEKIKENK